MHGRPAERLGGAARRAAIPLVFALVLAAGTTRAEVRAGAESVLVWDVQAEDAALQGLATELTEGLLAALAREPSLAPIGRHELEAAVGVALDAGVLRGEREIVLPPEARTPGGPKRVVTGHLGRLGEDYVVTLALVDPERVAVVRDAAVTSADPEALAGAVGAAARQLFGPGAPPREGACLGSPGTQAWKLAVLDLAALDVGEGLAASLTELLALEIRKFGGLDVIGWSELRRMLDITVQRMILECRTDATCLVRYGGALGVDSVVAGSIGRLGAAWVIVLKRMDVHDLGAVARVAESFVGPAEHLDKALRVAVARLLCRPLDGFGSARVRSTAGPCGLTGAGTTDASEDFVRVPAGKYGAECRGDGYVSRAIDLFVLPDELTDLRVTLEELPQPWYEKWWTWTLIGTAVATVAVGTGLAVHYLSDAPESGSGVVHVTPP